MGVNRGENRGTDRAKLEAMVDDRRARVASGKVRGLSIRQIRAEMAGSGCVNPKTGEAWSVGILMKDLKALDERWKAEALRDTSEHRRQELQEIAEIEREAW